MNISSSLTDLLKKYDVPAPRYTSYPTVPCWDNENFSVDTWFGTVKKTFDYSLTEKGLSIYIHLPFCESLCTYCACTTRITKNHNVEIPYIQALIKEWNNYKEVFGAKPLVKELHLGGGTPTFFDAKNLQWLITTLLEDVIIAPDFEFSFEGHPNNTSFTHLKTLYDLGFRRVSFGVQDLDPKVQHVINRMQSFSNLRTVTEQVRAIGYKSVSFDLIYGLPLQTPFTVTDTIEKIITLKPDRIAFYSYAHVPWIKPGQRSYSESDLPSFALKRHLYEIGRHLLTRNDYYDIGMDHFALRHDSLFKAAISGNLHRNFMGYTTSNTDLLIGLGASAISDAHLAYAQNEKKVEAYLKAVKDSGTAVVKGHNLTEKDLLIRECILQITCQSKLEKYLLAKVITPSIERELTEMEEERILYRNEDGLFVTGLGKPFIRNICQIFDDRMTDQEQLTPIFSKSV
jgi:oxygen-independent coproporphyrinogen-3 oxidase